MTGLFLASDIYPVDQQITMKTPPLDQRLARILVAPLAHSSVRPNHITALTLILVICAGVLFAFNDATFSDWAAGIFVIARFLDHFDGELARLQGTKSKFGYYFDYVVGGVGYAALFLGLGLGYWQSDLGDLALFLGLCGAVSAIISLFINLQIDKEIDNLSAGTAIGYPSLLGFELEDGIYLLAPITWLGFLEPFFIAAGIGASIYCFWTIFSLAHIRFKG